jgi:hypothetical protein
MKKTLIIVGAVLILLILGLWAFFYFTGGMPKNTDEIFARFGLSDQAPPVEPEPEPGDPNYEYVPDPEPTQSEKRLRQLTTRATAGATFIGNTVRFVERGTGHIYDIDVRGGTETIVSPTTKPRTMRAVFGNMGNAVALTYEGQNELTTVLGVLDSGTDEAEKGLNFIEFRARASEVAFSRDEKDLLFLVKDEGGSTAYAYNLETKDTRELFALPLSDVRMLWGAPHYVYTIPANKSIGYVYRIDEGRLSYVTNGGKGLMAMHHASGTVVSTFNLDGTQTTRDTETGFVPLLNLFTEKCDISGTWSRLLVCASPMSLPPGYVYPDDWFKGLIGFSDRILRVDSANGGATVLSNLEEESGRALDVSQLVSNETGNMLVFINKYDNALWLLDLRPQ